MCGSKVVKKIFGGGDSPEPPPTPATPVAAPTPTPAVSVDAPTKDIETGVTSEREQRRTRAKGKKRLTISARNLGGGTGVNI